MDPSQLPAPASTASGDPGSAREKRLPGLRILLAEDNSEVREIMCGVLARRGGHSVTTAANGREALSQLTDDQFDVVLMDLEMPEMGGLEATRALRERERESGRRPVPVIAMTAHADADRRELTDAGMNAYLIKPVETESLMNTLAEVVKRR